MRSDPSDRSEMTNQLLFGEGYEILQQQKKWSYVKLLHDNYEGWVDNKQITAVDQEYYQHYLNQNAPVSSELIEIISHEDSGVFFPIYMGSLLPGLNGNQKLNLAGTNYEYLGPVENGARSRAKIVHYAHQYMHAPYLWGGRSPMGIDCSGYTQIVYRLAGYQIPRDSPEQADQGDTLSFIEESQPGDLAFFDNEDGDIIHVGIILERNYILHASGKVRLDRLDQYGIFNRELNTHTHRLRVIKKIV